MNITQSQTMSSREIAHITGKRHADVMRDARKMLQELEIPERNFASGYIDGNNQERPEFLLNKDLTITLVSGYNVKMRFAIVERWQELETQQSPAIPKTLSEALRLAADQAEFIEQQAELLEKQQPSVEFVERYVESSGTFGFREICKQLGAKENKFRAFLQSQKIMYRLGSDWTPYAQHMDKGLFEVKTGTANGHAYKSPRFTAKGAEWISGAWAKYLKKNPEVKA